MHRTQILLEQEQYRLLGEEAIRRGTSLAAIIRRLVDEHFGLEEKQESDPLRALKGIGTGTGEPIGRDHDRHLYGSGS